MTPTGPVLTRRQMLRATAITAGVAVMAPTLATTAHASPTILSAAAPVALRDLQQRYGTPTDLARTAAAEAETVWTLDSEGTVLTFDKAGSFWAVAAHQDWATVLTFGTAVLTRWGRPSGPNQVVLVFGTAPEPPPTAPPGPTTDPTAPTTSAGPTTSAAPTGSSTTPSSASTIATTAGSTSFRQVAAPPGSNSSGPVDGELSYTGINLGRLGLIAAGLLTAGGALLAVRRRRMAPDPESKDPS